MSDLRKRLIALAMFAALVQTPLHAQEALAGDPVRGQQQFGPCTACHTVNLGGPNMTGPNLHGVIGKKAGTNQPNFAYSAELKASGLVWTPATLNTWITDPAALVPHTKMTYPGNAKASSRANIIAYLEKATN
jgi:cytochrome c